MNENTYSIYTSYFSVSAENTNSLSICPRTPPWYAMGRAEDIMCNKELYDLYFHKLKISQEDFYQQYLEQTVSKLDPYKVLEEYRGKILLGFYASGRFDCRQLFTRWIKETTGINIPELDAKNISLLAFL